MTMTKDEWFNVGDMVRTTDPNTSKNAAKEVIKDMPKARDRVLYIIKVYDDIGGVISEKIDATDGVTTSKYRTAIKKLHDTNYITPVGTRKSKHGKEQRVWRLTDKGREHFNQQLMRNV